MTEDSKGWRYAWAVVRLKLVIQESKAAQLKGILLIIDSCSPTDNTKIFYKIKKKTD